MVQAIIKISDHTNRILNIIKAKYGLKDKSQAIEVMAGEYEDAVLEPKLKPSYVKKAKKIMKGKYLKVGSVENFKKKYSGK